MGYINLGPYHKLTKYTSKNSLTAVLRGLYTPEIGRYPNTVAQNRCRAILQLVAVTFDYVFIG